MKKENGQNEAFVGGAISVISGIISIGSNIFNLFSSQKIKNVNKRKEEELIKWLAMTTEKLNTIEQLLIEIGTGLSKAVRAEFTEYVTNCLMADVKQVAAQYEYWAGILEGDEQLKKVIVVRTIADLKQKIFNDTLIATNYGFSCCDAIALALTTIISLCELIDDTKGVSAITPSFQKYFKDCLDPENKNSVVYALAQYQNPSTNNINNEKWYVLSLIHTKTNIEKYLTTTISILNPGIQLSINFGFIRLFDSNDYHCSWMLSNSNIDKPMERYLMQGSKIEVEVLGDNLDGETIAICTKVIKIVAMDIHTPDEIFYNKSFYEDSGWVDLCQKTLNTVEKIDFSNKLVLVIISGAHVYQFPTPELATWMREKLGANLKEWKIQTDGSGPSDACCYFYLGESTSDSNSKPKQIEEKFASNWDSDNYNNCLKYGDLESYMVRINYHHPLS